MYCNKFEKNVEGISWIPKMWKDISLEELFAFMGSCIVSGVLWTRKEPVAKLWKTNAIYARANFYATKGKRSVLSNSSCHLFRWQNYKKSTEINRQISSNEKCKGCFKKMDTISYGYISWTMHGMWMIYITFERGGTKFSNTTATALA